MRAIYEKLLDRMQRDQFQVFTKRYHLSRLEKMICIARVLLARSR
jgi:phytoene/squalene synthetase